MSDHSFLVSGDAEKQELDTGFESEEEIYTETYTSRLGVLEFNDDCLLANNGELLLMFGQIKRIDFSASRDDSEMIYSISVKKMSRGAKPKLFETENKELALEALGKLINAWNLNKCT